MANFAISLALPPACPPDFNLDGILNPDLPGSGELKPVLSLRTQLVFLKDVPAGTPIGYSSTWRAERPLGREHDRCRGWSPQ